MRGFRIFGEIIFEYLAVSLILILSAILVIPFVPAFIGVVSYYKNKRDYRLLKDIFLTIGRNYRIIIKFTILEVIILGFSSLNLYFFISNYESKYAFIIVVSAVAMLIGLLLLVNAPIVIYSMNVNLRQLVYNSIMLTFGGVFRTFVSLIILIGFAFTLVYIPYLSPFLIIVPPMIIGQTMFENMYVLKSKALGKRVEELKREETDDHYLNEYGEVDHESETK